MILQVLGWLAIGLLALLVAILFLPIHLRLAAQSHPIGQASVQVRPFGGVCPPITVFDSTRKATKKPKPAEPRKKKAPKKQRKSGWKMRGNLLAEIRRLIRRVINAIHIDDLRANAEFGMGDPAETGQLYGQLSPLVHASGGHLRLQPNFEKACLRGSGQVKIHFRIIGMIWPLTGFAWRVFGPSR